MNWNNLLYFSTGEKRALTILVCLIASAVILLVGYTENEKQPLANDLITEQQAPDSVAKLPSAPTTALSATPPRKAYKPYKPIAGKQPVYASDKTPPRYPKADKYTVGTVVELNTADTTQLKKIPGIGSTFAKRIVLFRTRLGGFYTVEQVREVYGITSERYAELQPWFRVDSTLIQGLEVNKLPFDSLRKHPYLSFPQIRVLLQQRQQKGLLTGWEPLVLLEEFTEADIRRLTPYLRFESEAK